MLTINPINNYNPNFTAFRHEIKNYRQKVINRGDTCLFRYDLYFDRFIDFLRAKYQNMSKVNFVIHACSDGEEVFSVLSKMIDMIGIEESKKFLPLIAIDKEQQYIDVAKQAKYNIESFEQGGIDFHLGTRFENYFIQLGKRLFTPKNDLKKNVIFMQGDILDDTKHIDFSNTVLMARNFWPYLSCDEQEELARTLAERMSIDSTLVIGDYDKEFDVHKLLNKHGFSEVFNIPNVFEKTFV